MRKPLKKDKEGGGEPRKSESIWYEGLLVMSGRAMSPLENGFILERRLLNHLGKKRVSHILAGLGCLVTERDTEDANVVK